MSSKYKPNIKYSYKKSSGEQQNIKNKNFEVEKDQKNNKKNKLIMLNSYNLPKFIQKKSIITYARNFNEIENPLQKFKSISNALKYNTNLKNKIIINKPEEPKKSKENIVHKDSVQINEKNKINSYKKSILMSNKLNWNFNKKISLFRSPNKNHITPNPLSRHKSIEKSNKIDYVKLICEGNRSYIIACSYCLINNPKLSEYILENYNEKQLERKKMGISYFFSRIIYHFKNKDRQNYPLHYFYDSIKKKNPCFNNNETISASNFLIYSLDMFHKEDKICKNLNIETELTEKIYSNILLYQQYLIQEENSFIFSNFSLINEKKMKCLNCGNVTQTYTYFFTYDLNIESGINKNIIKLKANKKLNEMFPYITIQKLIDFQKEEERLYNVYCDSCDKKTNLIRTSEIYSASNYLIFLLNDIEQEKTIKSIKENNVEIIIEKKLNLETKNNSNLEYIINSVVYYDVDNKEYFCYCNRKNHWLKCTKNDINIETSSDFLDDFNWKFLPVIIFYESSNMNNYQI